MPVIEKRPHDHSVLLTLIPRLAAALIEADPEEAERIQALASLDGIDLDEESGVPGLVLSMLLDEAWFCVADRALVFETAAALDADRDAWCAEQGVPRYEFPVEDGLSVIACALAKPFLDAVGHDVLFGAGHNGLEDPNRERHPLEEDAALIKALRLADAYDLSLIERGAYPMGDDRRLPSLQEDVLVSTIRTLAARVDEYFEDNHLVPWAMREVDRVRNAA